VWKTGKIHTCGNQEVKDVTLKNCQVVAWIILMNVSC